MNASIAHVMTDEIAYRLGKLDFPCFYDCVLWKINKEPFELIHFFDWSLGFGTPLHKVGDKLETDWNAFTLFGRVKFEKIETISQKLAYIRGRLSSYSVTIDATSIHVGYANSYDTRDFFAICLGDVIMDRFALEPVKLGEIGRSITLNCPKYCIQKSEIVGTTPGTPSVELKGDPEVISYIVGATAT